MNFFIDKSGNLYSGDLCPGDREATPAEIKAHELEIVRSTYTAAIQDRLDDFARTRNYDGILSAATYATSAVPKLKAEGQYAVEARDATWAKGYEILAAVEAGTRPLPTLEGLAAELPRTCVAEMIYALAWLGASLILAPFLGAFIRFGMEGKP